MFQPRPENAAWYASILASLTGPVWSPLGERLPPFPDTALQVQTTGLSGEPCVQQVFGFYEDTVEALQSCGVQITPSWRLLDFGTGWGRVARVFLRHLPKQHILGLDVDAAFIAIATRDFGTTGFTICTPHPPTAVASSSIDLVTAYSVLSHLAEPIASAWVDEFARILKPGGFFSFTTRNITFLDYCETLAGTDGYSRGLAQMVPDFNAARDQYRRGAFLYASGPWLSGGAPRESSFYGEAFIPAQYVRERFSQCFEVTTPEGIDRGDLMRGFVLRRR